MHKIAKTRINKKNSKTRPEPINKKKVKQSKIEKTYLPVNKITTTQTNKRYIKGTQPVPNKIIKPSTNQLNSKDANQKTISKTPSIHK